MALHSVTGASPQSVGDRTSVGTTLNTMGMEYRNLGQYEQTRGYFTNALGGRQAVAIAARTPERSHPLPL